MVEEKIDLYSSFVNDYRQSLITLNYLIRGGSNKIKWEESVRANVLQMKKDLPQVNRYFNSGIILESRLNYIEHILAKLNDPKYSLVERISDSEEMVKIINSNGLRKI